MQGPNLILINFIKMSNKQVQERQDIYLYQVGEFENFSEAIAFTTPRSPIEEEYPPVEELSECSDLEKRIDILRAKIQEHRMRTGGQDCWYFGSFHLKYDYGLFWDNTEKWHSMVEKDGGEDLAPFGYRSMEGACCECQEVTKEMNKAWEKWKMQMGVLERGKRRRRQSLFSNIFGCFRKSK